MHSIQNRLSGRKGMVGNMSLFGIFLYPFFSSGMPLPAEKIKRKNNRPPPFLWYANLAVSLLHLQYGPNCNFTLQRAIMTSSKTELLEACEIYSAEWTVKCNCRRIHAPDSISYHFISTPASKTALHNWHRRLQISACDPLMRIQVKG